MATDFNASDSSPLPSDHAANLSAGSSTISDRTSALAPHRTEPLPGTARDLPALEVQQDGLTVDYNKNGSVRQVKDGDGVWVSNDGYHFSQAGNPNIRTLSKDNEGHLLFVDPQVIDKEAQRINLDLKELHQLFSGRTQDQCERDLRNALADKNPQEIRALDYSYYNQYKSSLSDVLMRDSKLTTATRDALGLYWKGANQRTDADVLKMAGTALDSRNANLFQEAMRDASPAARKTFIDNYGAQKIYQAFTVAQINEKTGLETGRTETPDLARAYDYMYSGKLSVATQVRDSKGKQSAVESAIAGMSENDRRNYMLGKAASEGGQFVGDISASDLANAKNYYQQTKTAFDRMGNNTQVALWEGLVVTPDNGTLAKLAGHRHWPFNDTDATVAGDINNINGKDLASLRDKSAGPVYRGQIDNVLRSYLPPADAAQIMTVVDKKMQAPTFADARIAGQPHVLDSISDNVHYFRSNDQPAMVKALVDMTTAEQSAYKGDPIFRDALNQAVEKHMSGPGLDAARYILKNTLTDNGKFVSGREDIVVKLYEHAMSDGANDGSQAARELQAALNADQTLKERLTNPKTAEDKAFAADFHKAAEASLNYRSTGGKVPVNFGTDPYLKPLLGEGHITTALAIHINNEGAGKINTEKFLADMQSVAPAEKNQLQTDNTFRSLALAPLSDQQKNVLLHTFAQGKINPEDKIKAALIDGDNASILAALKEIKPADMAAAERSFADKKYGRSMENAVTSALSGAEKAQAVQAFRKSHEGVPEQEIDAQIDASHARSGLGSHITDKFGYGSGAQLDEAVNRSVHAKVDATRAGKHLTDDQLQHSASANYSNLDNFLKDKQSAADTVTNLTTVAGTIGLTLATGGATLPLLAAGTTFGASCRVASQKLIMGENYDTTLSHLSKDALLGAVQGGAMALTPGLLGAGRAAADLATTEVLAGAAGKTLSAESKQVVQSGMRNLVQSALKNGASSVADADVDALAIKAGNPALAQDIKAALPRAYQKEFEKTAADGLKQLKTSTASGAVGGGVSGAGSEAINGDSHDKVATRAGKIVRAGTLGALQGAAAGAAFAGAAYGLRAALKPAAAGQVSALTHEPPLSEVPASPLKAPVPEVTAVPVETPSPEVTAVPVETPSPEVSAQADAKLAPVIERSASGQIVATTDSHGVKAEYTWGERDGKQVLTRVKYDGVEQKLTDDGRWQNTEVAEVDGYGDGGDSKPGKRGLDEQGNLIRIDDGDAINKQTKYLLNGEVERDLHSGGKILASREGLPLQVTDAKGNKISYDWHLGASQADLQSVTITSENGANSTHLTKSANGWTASSTGEGMLPKDGRIADVTVRGGGVELQVKLDGTATDAPAAPADVSNSGRSISYYSDGSVTHLTGASVPLDAAQSATSRLLKDGRISVENPRIESGLLKVVRYGNVTDENGNSLRIFVRPLNDAGDKNAVFRIRQTQIARDLHAIDGDTGASPAIVVRDVMIDGKLTPCAIQPDQGDSFLSELRRWTAASKGIEVEGVSTNDLMMSMTNQDMADFIQANPQLNKAVGTAYARRMADGGMDFQGSNWSVQESIGGKAVDMDKPIHLTDIDSKRSYSTDHTVTYGKEMEWGDQAVIARAFENKRLSDISPELQAQMEARLKIEESAAGQKAMAKAGLSPEQIVARIERTRSLVEHGFPPAPGEPMAPGIEAFTLPREYHERLEEIEKQMVAGGRTATLDDVLKHNDTLGAH